MRHMSFVMVALAALLLVIAGCDREITGDVKLADQSASNCFECHSDRDFALLHAQDQFAVSKHATGETVERNRQYSSRYQSCERCHTHEGFVAVATGTEVQADDFTNFNCFTCHAPHSDGNLTVRLEDAQSIPGGYTYDKGSSNTCAYCHQSRDAVEVSVPPGAANITFANNRWGPHHSIHADVFLGVNGYEYDGYTYTNSWHTTGIDEGCVTCHMSDKNTNAMVGGHTFSMVGEFHEEEVENLAACTKCHEAFESFNVDFPANSDYDWDGAAEGVQVEVEGLLDSLATLLVGAGVIDAEDHLPVANTTISADSAGAVYNYLFIHGDRSEGIHNTNYIVGLLQSSINFIVHRDPNGGATVAARPATFSAH